MGRTKIEWVRNEDGTQGHTVNPVKGYCPIACPYCYARRMYDRFGWDKTIRYDPFVFRDLPKEPSRVFVGSTMELFGDWIPELWMQSILGFTYVRPHHTYIFLTKQPQNLIKWSPFPDNCWIGVSATNAKMAEEAGFWLWEVKAKVKFVSFEPLLEAIPAHFADYISEDVQGVSWVIIGAETGNRKGKPALSDVHRWAGEIIKAADSAGIPVFCKKNLGILKERREYPHDHSALPGRGEGDDVGGKGVHHPA